MNWKKLLFPPIALVLALSIFSGGGLVWVFWKGLENTPIAYALYPVSAYAVTVLTAAVVKLCLYLRRRPRPAPDQAKRQQSFWRSFLVGQLINTVYGVVDVALGIRAGSGWVGGMGIYHLVQGFIQLTLILRKRFRPDVLSQWKGYRLSGWLLLALNTAMGGLIFQMIHMGRSPQYPGFMIFAIAFFAFYKLIAAFVKVAKDRRHKSPMDSAVRMLSLSQALFSLLTLQAALLRQFGEDPGLSLLMNTLTGTAVSILVISTGIYMIRRARREMKKTNQENDYGTKGFL